MGKLQYTFLGIGVVLIGILLIVIRFITPTKNTQPHQSEKKFVVKIQNKKLVSGLATIRVIEGDKVLLTVYSDTNDELHLHGYDKMIDLLASTPAMLRFTANITGHFEYELEHERLEIGAIDVLPR